MGTTIDRTRSSNSETPTAETVVPHLLPTVQVDRMHLHDTVIAQQSLGINRSTALILGFGVGVSFSARTMRFATMWEMPRGLGTTGKLETSGHDEPGEPGTASEWTELWRESSGGTEVMARAARPRGARKHH